MKNNLLIILFFAFTASYGQSPVKERICTSYQVESYKWVDMDLDGDDDMFAQSNYFLIWFENRGSADSVFTPHEILIWKPYLLWGDESIIGKSDAGDMDNDGDIDIAFVYAEVGFDDEDAEYFYTARPAWMEQISDGNWQEHIIGGVSAASSDPPLKVVMTDINQDGQQDIVFDSENLFWVEITGTNSGILHQVTTQFCRQYIVADFDNDSDEDIIYTTYYGGQAIMLLANDAGIFTKSTLQTIDVIPEISNFDFDKDGDQDILSAINLGGNSGLHMMTNLGGLNFTDFNFVAPSYSREVIIDYDNDGDYDIISGDFFLSINTGLSYSEPEPIIYFDDLYETAQLTDINNDGYPELTYLDHRFFNGFYGGKVCIIKNEAGVFDPSSVVTVNPLYMPIANVTVADINNDGYGDIIAADIRSNIITSLFIPEDLAFSDSVSVIDITRTNYFPVAILPLDAENDGDIDLIVQEKEAVYLYHNLDGMGKFGEAQVISEYAAYWPGFTFDLEGDGDADYLQLEREEYNSVVAYHNNSGIFMADTIFGDNNIESITISDYDLDGDSDLIISNLLPHGIFIMPNEDGIFGEPVLIDGFDAEYSVPLYLLMIDEENDGDEDLFYFYDHDYYCLKNNGDGSFSSPEIRGTFTSNARVSKADMNFDGYTDLIIYGGNSIFGLFAAAETYAVLNTPGTGIFGDAEHYYYDQVSFVQVVPGSDAEQIFLYSYWIDFAGLDSTGFISPVQELAQNNWIKIFPNPASDFISLQSENSCYNLNLKIISMTGEIVYAAENQNLMQGETMQIPVKNLSAGLYIISCSGENGRISQNIISIQK